MKGSDGSGPGTIYFLTDGFELSSEGGKSFCMEVKKLREELAGQTKIHTIGFWSEDADKLVLEKIARDSGGQAVIIN